ncbi:MAG TPA: hypothetical protein VK735_20930 [Pseudonocardia sp.]|uniref:hypothetical protein n=1 Tax=Pseudonocardia sp. TaxID=60912 RepID=UPI002C263726|nr:hypothetical protein [Pseudonocardia sp.]HTF49914.1 hypothetical protein [Pseudonocardia sp.]
MRAGPFTAGIVALAAIVFGALAGCGNSAGQRDTEEPIPTFSNEPGSGRALGPTQRETLLPIDCTDVLAGPAMSALLGQPVDSVSVHTVLGLPAPSVGRLERLTCQYDRPGHRAATADLEMVLAAYTSRAAADKQLSTNVAAERFEAAASDSLSIGSARAVLFDEKVKSVLMVSSGRSSITMTMQRGVVPPEYTRAVMVDMVQRVLPNLAREPTGESR